MKMVSEYSLYNGRGAKFLNFSSFYERDAQTTQLE